MFTNYVTYLRKFFLLACLVLGLLSPAITTAQIQYDAETMAMFQEDTNGLTADGEIKGPAKSTGQYVEINTEFFVSLGINLGIILLITVFIYYRNYKRLDTVFTFVMFNVVIFLLTYVFNMVKFSMGAAFGLFAIFSMLRYRTTSINMKDMTYLFIFIAVGLLSAIHMEYYEQLMLGGVIFLLTFIMDTKLFVRRESMKVVRFDDINLILPEKEPELIEVLKKRTGLNIHRVSIQDLDFLKDSAVINVFYYEK